jgi:hypothetical protein
MDRYSNPSAEHLNVQLRKVHELDTTRQEKESMGRKQKTTQSTLAQLKFLCAEFYDFEVSAKTPFLDLVAEADDGSSGLGRELLLTDLELEFGVKFPIHQFPVDDREIYDGQTVGDLVAIIDELKSAK